jgi:hypothetical protein
VRRILLLLCLITNLQYTRSLVAGDNDTATNSIDLVEVAPMLRGRPASVLRDANRFGVIRVW